MNLANKITMFRVALIPVFIIVLNSNMENAQLIAAIIFIGAALTDTLDGYIARSRNLVTTFGKFVDPLADKLLVMAALISLVELGQVPAWMVIVIMAREFIITGFRTLAASDGVTIAASSWGKFKTITQLVAISLMLLNNFPFAKIGIPMDRIMLYLAVIFTIVSGVDYIVKNIKVLDLEDI